MNTQEKIEVMQAYIRGERIQYQALCGWIDLPLVSEKPESIAWRWEDTNYRIAPKQQSVDNGGLAFPVTPTDRGGQIADTQLGMTLLDYFAGQALAGWMANPCCCAASLEKMSEQLYEIATAMVAEKRRMEENK